MEEATGRVRELATTVKAYLHTRLESVKLSAAEKISLVISNLVAGAIVAVVFLFFLAFASIAGALALSARMGSSWSGFLVVAGIYLLIGFIAWKSKERLIRMPVMNNIIRQLFKEETDHEED